MTEKKSAFAFIDASNLFYGGESLGWKVDYKKLLEYLREKYGVTRAMYFGGVETYKFPHDYQANETVQLEQLETYLREKIANPELSEAKLLLLDKHISRVKFYRLLDRFGYELYLKPVKTYWNEGVPKRKANVDVDMAYMMMREIDSFDSAVFLSGDGDFLPVLRHLREKGKEVHVLARALRTAHEIKQFAGGDFRDFIKLQKRLEFKQ